MRQQKARDLLLKTYTKYSTSLETLIYLKNVTEINKGALHGEKN